jgi:glycosyltransferase involved in cell wall biosynthesis|tara:strand:+ start:520 stop:1716 length:1197 start_codon:yes stop_codon:yes gene_type:complete
VDEEDDGISDNRKTGMKRPLKLLWLCGVPFELEEHALSGECVGAHASWSWVMAHLPPPEGVELHIACPAKNIREDRTVEYRGATFYLFPYLKGAVYLLYRVWMPGFRRVYDAVEPDWVHGWGVEAGYGYAANVLDPRRSSVEIQGILADYLPHIRKNLRVRFALVNERQSLAMGKQFIAESAYSAREARKYTKGRVQVINQPLREDFLQSPMAEANGKQMIFLGSIEARKGIKDAVRAFAEAGAADWKLVCVGSGGTAYVAEVQALINELGVSDRVELCGTLNSAEVKEQLQCSSVFLLPTYMDTGPNALKEAMAMGLWPVCFDNSGPGELISRYGLGELAETGNIDALAHALRTALAERPWEDWQYRTSCVERIRKDLSRETVWRELLIYYDEVIRS